MKYFYLHHYYFNYLIKSLENLRYFFYFVYWRIRGFKIFIDPETHFLKYFKILIHLLPLHIHILLDPLRSHFFLQLILLCLVCFLEEIFVSDDLILPLEMGIYHLPPFLNYFQNFTCFVIHFSCPHLQAIFYLMFMCLINRYFYLMEIFCYQIRTNLDYFDYQLLIKSLLDF
jgi:hypothetical protein